MPTFDHVRRSARAEMAPDESASWTDRVWPAMIALAAVIVFITFLVLGGLLLAVVMTLATVAATVLLVTLVTGTAWLTRLRGLVPHLRGHH